MLTEYMSEIILQGKKLRTFLLFGIYTEVDYKAFLKNTFLKNNTLKNKINKHVL